MTPLTLNCLTPIQQVVLKRLAEGASRKTIAQERKVSLKTIEYHCMEIMKTLHLRSVAELTQWALAMGLTRLKFGKALPSVLVNEVDLNIRAERQKAEHAEMFKKYQFVATN